MNGAIARSSILKITINFEIERNENTIKDYMEYINRDIEKGCFPQYIQEDIISYQKEVEIKSGIECINCGPEKIKILGDI